MEILPVLLWKKRVTPKVMAFQHCIYTCFVCSRVCACVCGKKKGDVLGVYKGGCETGEAIKSLAFTLAALPTKKKNVARLGAAEVPADRETSVVSLRFFFFFFSEPARGPALLMFPLSLQRVGLTFFFVFSNIYSFIGLFVHFYSREKKKTRIASVQL